MRGYQHVTITDLCSRNVVCVPMAAPFLATYRVFLPAIDQTLGYLRLDVGGQEWIARNLGNDVFGDTERAAASVRRFPERQKAIDWLVNYEPAGQDIAA